MRNVLSFHKKQWWEPWASVTAWYKFEWDSKDYSWNNRDATEQTSTLSYATDGNLVYAVFNNTMLSASNWLSSANYTASAWIKSSEERSSCLLITWWSGNNMQPLAFNKGSETSNKYIFQSRYWIWSASYCPPIWTAPDELVITLNQWKLVTAVRKDGVCYLYVNWSLCYSGSITTELRTEEWHIWNQWTNSTLYFNGWVSNLIIDQSPRTLDEIIAYYNLTKSNYQSSSGWWGTQGAAIQ